MGSVIGCTRNICFQNATKEINIDLLKNNNFENIYTINSTSKNEQTKPSALIQEKEEIKVINNEREYKEKEEDEIKEEVKEEKIKEENSFEIDNNKEEDNENKEEKILNTNKMNSQESNSNKDSISITDNKYKDNINKIIIIQRKYRKHREKIKNKEKENEIKNKEKKGNNLSVSNRMAKTLTTNSYHGSINVNKKGEDDTKKNGGKNEMEEIISIDNSHIIGKKSSKVLNNFKAMESLKNSMVVSNQTNLFKFNPEIKNYFRMLGDFGEKLSFVKQPSNLSKKFDLTQITLSKNKREILTKKTKDNIKGNFIQKNEKVIRYQGGFLKKTRKKNGFGIITWSDGSKLKGIFESNELNGICKFYNYKHKSTFIGEYSNNHPKGFGVYSVKSFSLQGYWESENLNGIAIEVWEDGTYFQGEYKDNKKNGIGLYRWPDGTIYQGEFRDGQMNGKGIILYSNDCIFSGEIENGYMNGYGNFSWGNGSICIRRPYQPKKESSQLRKDFHNRL